MPGTRPGMTNLRLATWQPCPPSPPSPRNPFPKCRRSTACRLATAAAGIRYPGPHRRAARAARPGHDGGGRVHALEMPVGAGRMVPRAAEGRQGARAGGQFRQRQRLHRQERPRSACKFTAEIAASAVGCEPAEVFLASTGVIGEPLDATQVRRRDGRPRRATPSRRLARRRQGDHDHRHVSEGRDRHGQDRQAHRSPSTASPRAPA